MTLLHKPNSSVQAKYGQSLQHPNPKHWNRQHLKHIMSRRHVRYQDQNLMFALAFFCFTFKWQFVNIILKVTQKYMYMNFPNIWKLFAETNMKSIQERVGQLYSLTQNDILWSVVLSIFRISHLNKSASFTNRIKNSIAIHGCIKKWMVQM